MKGERPEPWVSTQGSIWFFAYMDTAVVTNLEGLPAIFYGRVKIWTLISQILVEHCNHYTTLAIKGNYTWMCSLSLSQLSSALIIVTNSFILDKQIEAIDSFQSLEH